MSRFYLSPSRIARYYFLECDRFLRFMAVPGERRREEGIPSGERDFSPVTQAVLEGGYEWERHVLDHHLAGRVVMPPAAEDEADTTQDRFLAYPDTVEALRALQSGDAIYQATLQVPATFHARFGLDPALVGFRDCYPDLIVAVEGPAGPELRIIDVKASNWMKLSHRIQVGIYTLILGEVLAAEGIDTPISRMGGVWLYGEEQPEWFTLANILPPIETFFEDDLPKILQADAADAFWHLNYRCEWCEYFSHCRSEAETTDSVSLVPYLSHFAKRHLEETADIQTLADLETALASDRAPQIVAGCASLEGRLRQLRQSVKSLRTDQAIPTGASSVAMPAGEQIRLVLTLQSEPLTGEVYGYAINRVFGRDLYGSGRDTIARVASRGDDVALRRLRRSFVDDLTSILSVVHDHNLANAEDWWQQKSVQTYVFDTYERGLITSLLLQAALEDDIGDDALTLLFYFQRPEIVEAEDHPDTEVFFPVVALTEVVRTLFALPVEVSYQLAAVSEALQPSEYPWVYRESDFFSFRLSNRMKSNAIFEVWHRDRIDLVESIEGELKHRVWAANSVINGIRERLRDSDALFAWPPKFAFPEGSRLRSPLLSRLSFIARYEAVVGYLDIRTRRGAPLEERLAGESTLRLTYRGDDRYEIDHRQREADISRDPFFNWIVTGDHEAGRRARLAFDDFGYRDRNYAPKNLDLALAAIAAIDDGELRLSLKPSKSFTQPRPGDVVFLEPRYTDWTTKHLLAELAHLDAAGGSFFEDLLSDPVGTRRALASTDLERVARERARSVMTASQYAAMDGLAGHNVQLVWGPPGTGKTHFLALAVLAMLEGARRAGRPCRVLITAMTNAAIDNCLAKLVELRDQHETVRGSFRLAKLQTGDDGSEGPIASVDPKRAATDAGDHELAVYGATVWQARKTSPAALRYDLVVIDEGSQLLVAQAAIAIARLGAAGRLLIAGDDKQLAPIVQAEYPTPDGGVPLHRSILEALRAVDTDDLLTATLVENWRMNDRLCEYPRRSIYPEEYRPATPEIARRRLHLNGSAPDVVAALCDPDWPVTMCVLEDVRATSRNPVEAALAAEVVCGLRDVLAVDDDQSFAARSMFVVSPHHAQIRLVRQALRERRRWSPLPLVDTVDKMQGQERDAVVVSYGVSDVETALNEKQFIYALNRLNVAITRARAKTVLFIPRPLLEPPIQVLDDDDVADGVAFMQGLMHWCHEQSEPLTRHWNGSRMTIYRG